MAGLRAPLYLLVRRRRRRWSRGWRGERAGGLGLVVVRLPPPDARDEQRAGPHDGQRKRNSKSTPVGCAGGHFDDDSEEVRFFAICRRVSNCSDSLCFGAFTRRGLRNTRERETGCGKRFLFLVNEGTLGRKRNSKRFLLHFSQSAGLGRERCQILAVWSFYSAGLRQTRERGRRKVFISCQFPQWRHGSLASSAAGTASGASSP